MNIPSAIAAAFLVARQTHGDAHATTDAKGGKTTLRIPALHLIEQRGEDPGAGGTNWMADSDSAASARAPRADA